MKRNIWRYFLAVGLLCAAIYIGLDDNNIVSSRVEDTVYYLAWSCFFVTIFILIKNKVKSSSE